MSYSRTSFHTLMFLLVVSSGAYAMQGKGGGCNWGMCFKVTEKVAEAALPMLINVGGQIVASTYGQQVSDTLAIFQKDYPTVFNTLVSVANNQKVEKKALEAATPILKAHNMMDAEGNLNPIVISLVQALVNLPKKPSKAAKSTKAEVAPTVLSIDEALALGKIKQHSEDSL